MNTTVANHKGKVRLVAELNTNLNGVPVQVPQPVMLTAANVGPQGQPRIPVSIPIPDPIPKPSRGRKWKVPAEPARTAGPLQA